MGDWSFVIRREGAEGVEQIKTPIVSGLYSCRGDEGSLEAEQGQRAYDGDEHGERGEARNLVYLSELPQ
jgi:hypothetical protein